MNNAQLGAAFDEIADILEFQGANPFRVRAYRNAARTIRDLPESIAGIVADPERSLTDIEGIGTDLAEKLTTLIETGRLPMLDELRSAVPASVLLLMRIPGVGPKKAAHLHQDLGINNLDELQAACAAGKVRLLKGFGLKTEQAILAGLQVARAGQERMYWAEADVYVQAILAHLQACSAVKQLAAAGSYRRGRETVGDLDFLVVSPDADAVMEHLARFDAAAEVLARGDTKMSLRLPAGLQVDLRVVPAESFGAALQYFTGSKEHNVILRGRAKDRGLKINEYGVFDGTRSVAGRTEKEVYAALDLPVFPPELREGRREFEWADAGELPKLIELDDLRGDLHMHTVATDGTATIREMVAAAQARGLSYIAITDHSKRVTMARGLDATRLRRQWREIDKLNERLEAFHVLKGVECDILEKGGLDLPDDVLAEADWVVCSVHYGQNQPRERITARILEAIENPHVAAIAHPTGRLINRRKPYEVDLEAVIRAAHQHHKILELNANPARLDLDDVACAAAKAQGVPIVISSDAHSPDGFNVLRYGILQARRAGLTAKDVINTRTWAQLKKLLAK
ncbi:MAG: DNA polymerase/3'-5' exonuclease PolX [Pirellulales bacterium]|nr:DNA polymerase/3'-5' exonuclease PolX [Pirellulales bacterium]